jgi:hypothetical protein
VVALALGSCAYGTSTALLPAHLKTVAIPVFDNQTTEFALEREITDAVIQRFVSDNHLRVVDERSAHSLIRGRIISYENSVFGISPVSRAEEYRVSVTVNVVFKDLVKNREIWSDEIIRSANYYVADVPGDTARTELDGRKEAITRIADEILARTIENW